MTSPHTNPKSARILRDYLERARLKTKHTPLGARQKRLLKLMRSRSQPLTVRQAYEEQTVAVGLVDVGYSLSSLELRGLVYRDGAGYRLTAAGKAVRL